MQILALDSSGDGCSVALMRDGGLAVRRVRQMRTGHAAVLPAMLAETLAAVQPAPSGLAAVAVTTGPGSFTGIRIAMAAAKGLALAIDRPLVGISCFDAVARAAAREGAPDDWDIMAIVLESRREDIFCKLVCRDGGETGAPMAAVPEDLLDRLLATAGPGDRIRLAGSAGQRVAGLIGPGLAERSIALSCVAPGPPDAADVAALAAVASGPGGPGVGYEPGLLPDYLRQPDVTMPER